MSDIAFAILSIAAIIGVLILADIALRMKHVVSNTYNTKREAEKISSQLNDIQLLREFMWARLSEDEKQKVKQITNKPSSYYSAQEN